MRRHRTKQTEQVLAALRGGATYGREIATWTKLASGTIHPILARLQRDGWVIATTEQGDPVRLERPLRRLYKLTDQAPEGPAMTAPLILSPNQQHDLEAQDRLNKLGEAARSWRHGNCGDDELIRIVDDFEAQMDDPTKEIGQ